MELQVHNAGTVTLSDHSFSCDFNEGLVHQVVTAYMAGGRAGTKAQKTRSEVSGGGLKPWRQKGTGRARAGSSRSPLWRTGGVTFAAKPRSYEQKINRKMYRAALRSILSELIRQDRLILIDSLSVPEIKTKGLVQLVKALGLSDNSSVLLVTPAQDDALYLSARNLPYVDVYSVTQLDPVSLVSYEKVVMTVDGVKLLEERLA